MTQQVPVFSVPLCERRRCGIKNSIEGYRLQIFDKIRSNEQAWCRATCRGGILWSPEYLEIFEADELSDVQPVYALLTLFDNVVGAFYFQRKRVTSAGAFQSKRRDRSGATLCLRGLIQSRLNFDVLFCGNIFLTGNHGMMQTTDMALSGRVLDAVFETVAAYLGNKNGHAPDLILVKDLNQSQGSLLENNQYKRFCTLPDMVVAIAPHWYCFDDYMVDMTSKYRTRARRARKKLAPLTCRELDVCDLENFAPTLSALFQNVISEAELNLIQVPQDYLSRLKKALKDSFVVMGYFDESGHLVGFQSAFLSPHQVDAHYVGYTAHANETHQLYLNMLYRYIEIAIHQKIKFQATNIFELKLARTAMEIKSSVGAEPQDLFCHFRHRQKTFNGILHLLSDYLYTIPEWTPRHPFAKK